MTDDGGVEKDLVGRGLVITKGQLIGSVSLINYDLIATSTRDCIGAEISGYSVGLCVQSHHFERSSSLNDSGVHL